jgi:hypothetical protein
MTKQHEANRSACILVYRANEINYCPACNRTHWYLGRSTAECAFCSTAIPLQDKVESSSIITKIGKSHA